MQRPLQFLNKTEELYAMWALFHVYNRMSPFLKKGQLRPVSYETEIS